ncbi:MAG: hypothetical protein A3J38_02070 [Gammaproteobacteria bacterium RIFCSPHIGHO2_12_FULL_45_9]|nr:MAG: hypothetical protein A3J38_02070 [Gammaproteobacteria bacterium RIFCSPHIGHO2_12_FULL_45_9]
MSKTITIQTGNLQDAAKEFTGAWHRAEKTGSISQPIEKITFTDQRLLFKTLTPRRFDILQYVHQHGRISIRALAKGVGREYSNVHQDVKVLFQLGLILKDEHSTQYYVPWDKIVTEISLATGKKDAHRQLKFEC